MKSIKGTFSRALPKGRFWQHRSNFRIVDSEHYLSNVIEYILHNYQKMNLPHRYGQPPYVLINRTAVDCIYDGTKEKGGYRELRRRP
ncbi:MAG: hypothetical protein HY420_04265 [Candidatus Kerfeldbacteria bacterium]|nr:hypothetical protein [Candidatus Kerfeldbacteria bacterium]